MGRKVAIKTGPGQPGPQEKGETMTEKDFAAITIMATVATYVMLSFLAYAQRGYFAFGGEIMVLLVMPICFYTMRSGLR